MKRNSLLSLLLLMAVMLLSHCSNDVDLYADYKEIPVVYGILDYQSDTNWIKITKAFSGPGNALEYAKNPDSSNYNGMLEVILTGRKNGIDLPVVVFDTLTVHTKEAGDTTFYFPRQLMYYSTEALDPEAKYTLQVTLPSGKKITATTELVQTFHISYPVRYIAFTTDKEVKWNTAPNGKRYEVDMVFHYQELLPGQADTLNKTVVWHLGTKYSLTTSGGEQMAESYSGDNFYKMLDSKLEKIPNVQRWTGNVDVYVACGSQDLDTYMQVNSGSTGLLQEIPVFTNINGGVGLFASRHTEVQSVPMTVSSEEILVNDYNLGFRFKQK